MVGDEERHDPVEYTGPGHENEDAADNGDVDGEELLPRRRRDTKIDEARAVLLAEVFGPNPARVFYNRQVEVLLERRFFHWITSRALRELAAEGRIASQEMLLSSAVPLRVYFSLKNRYWRRQAETLRRLVARFSTSDFARGLGRHGETMFDAALPTVGLVPAGRDVREYRGRRWTRTPHNLDRIFERDGVAYGVEIKNTLDYIPRDELRIKIVMCRELGLRPLFIMRSAPKNYMKNIIDAGGYGLIFGFQLYPFGQEAFAREVSAALGLPVDCPRRIAEGTVQRFLRWHRRITGIA
jgi:hypothetical protein